MPDARRPDFKNGAAAPGVVLGIRRRGDAAAANAAGGILMVDQGFLQPLFCVIFMCYYCHASENEITRQILGNEDTGTYLNQYADAAENGNHIP